ncbi:MAG: hypothetical protein JWQ11_1977 [Rhizobacter sp.]|nr:hypothetical protein [Rhizobacter sp.]
MHGETGQENGDWVRSLDLSLTRLAIGNWQFAIGSWRSASTFADYELRQSSPGMMRFMNSSNIGTVKAVSQWFGMDAKPCERIQIDGSSGDDRDSTARPTRGWVIRRRSSSRSVRPSSACEW